jgi:phosphatidylinositol alpha-1,6-mannosyltransferase
VILSLQTNSFGSYGGIPTYNRLVCRVLSGFDSSNRVLVAMDDQEDVNLAAAAHPNVQLSGFGGSRIRFVIVALQIVARNQVEVLLASHLNYAPVCWLLKLVRPRMKYGITIHGCEAWERIPLVRRWALQRADFILSVSEYTRQQAVKINGLKEERIFVLANALDWTADNAAASPESHALPPGIKLLSVGRLDATEQRKGFDTVIEALPAIAREVPSVQYIIIGSGTDLDRHKQLARDLGVYERVHFLGNVDEETLRHSYESCDVFVMPSAQEGFGIVYLEAMQYGKPVLAAKCGGSPEVVADGVTGLLTEYGNVPELSAALTRLCSDRGLRANLGSAGKERLNQRFTFDHFKETLVGVLQKQLRSRELPDAELADSNPAR